MKIISLTKGKTALIDDEDFPLVSKYNWYVLNLQGRDYAQATIWINGKNKHISMHRLIVGALQGKDVDHANHNTLDNRRCNLRECSRSQNHFNRLKGLSRSRFKGVSLIGWTYKGERFENGKWRARIKMGRKEIHLGTFESEEAAAYAYDETAKRMFGEFALLNFPLHSISA